MTNKLMCWYQAKVFPYLMNKNLSTNDVISERKSILSYAKGEILEIGIGTGNNLPLYPKRIKRITAIDSYVREVDCKRIKVDLRSYSCDHIQFSDNTFDTVVATFCMCSVQNPDLALAEIKRVLKPGGRILLLEHGKASLGIFQMIQKLLNPVYKLFACGCHTDRDHFELLRRNGFVIEKKTFRKCKIYPRCVVGYLYKAVAVVNKEES